MINMCLGGIYMEFMQLLDVTCEGDILTVVSAIKFVFNLIK